MNTETIAPATYIPPTFGGVRANDPRSRAFAQDRLQQYIQTGLPVAQSIVNRVMTQVPSDAVVRAPALRFAPGTGGVSIGFGSAERTLHRNALGQMAGRAGIPLAYVDGLAAGDAWKRDLLAHTLTQHFGHDDGRYLIRSIGSDVRGFMSDRYRRIDCRPVLETLIQAASKAGALVVNGTASDTRASLKIILPEIFEAVPGEFVAWGLSWTNSDFGKGANQLEVFGVRLVCWNGMVAEKAVRQIHLGRQIDDAIEFSERTLRLDTATAVSAVNDVAGHYLSRDTVKGYLGAIVAANAAQVDGKAAEAALAKRTTKGIAATVVKAFNGADVVELPPGNTDWRWSNAISLVARDTADADTKIDLERLAGDVLSRHGLKAA